MDPEKNRIRGTDQGFSSSNEHLESNTTRVFFIVSFPRIDSKPSPYLSRSSKTRLRFPISLVVSIVR